MRAHILLVLLGLAGPPILVAAPAGANQVTDGWRSASRVQVAAPRTCEGREATIVGTPGADSITGTSGNDVIVVGDGDDVVYGKGGDDRICGGSGTDELWGGPGHDRVFGGRDGIVIDEGTLHSVQLGDTLRGGTGRDWLDPGFDQRSIDNWRHDKIAWDTSPRAVRIDIAKGVAVGDGPDSFVSTGVDIVGSPYSDIIEGSPADENITGGKGADTLLGRGGTDDLSGGPGDDRLFGGRDGFVTSEAGDVTQVGDTLRGGTGRDWLDPGFDPRGSESWRHDRLAWDTSPRAVQIDIAKGVAVGDGPDSFVATGAEIFGSNYSDTIEGSPAGDVINGFDGSDTLHGRGGDDFLDGDSYGYGPKSGDDLLTGGPGNDTLLSYGGYQAGGGQDRLHGGPGDDFVGDFTEDPSLLYGDAGDDEISADLSFNERPQGIAGGTGNDQLTLQWPFSESPLETRASWNMANGDLRIRAAEGSLSAVATSVETTQLVGEGGTWRVSGTNKAENLLAGPTSRILFTGRGGNDSFQGSGGDDVFNGGPDTDTSHGMGEGQDTCISVEVEDFPDDCETVFP
jgi:Ca2+-binding RTX toxin-like protein